MKLVISRHCETNENAGQSADPQALSSAGQLQAEKLIELCRNENVAAVFHSAQPRALATAATLASALGLTPIELAGLEERNFGDWDSWEWPQIAAELDKLTAEERYVFVPPNGESWQQMEQRLRGALEQVAAKQYAAVAIVTHWGTIRALLPLVTDEPKESTLNLDIAYGQAFVIQSV